MGQDVYDVTVSLSGSGEYGGEYNVKAYGAKGDGVTDDTVAIIAAVTACKAAGGGEVFFPRGDYGITSAMIFSGLSNISFRGSGATISAIADIQSAAMLYMSDSTGVEVHGIEFDGNSRSIRGLEFRGCSDVFVDKCEVHHMGQTGSTTTYVAGIRVGNNGATGGEGVTIQGCDIHDIAATTAGGLISRGLVFFTYLNTGDVFIKDISVSDCKFSDISPHDDADGIVFQMTDSLGGYLGGSINASVIGCTFRDCHKRGIKIQNSGVAVTGCTITTSRTGVWGGSSWSGQQYAGISIYSGDVCVSDNMIIGTGSGAFIYGIETDGGVDDTSNITISGNTVNNGTDATGESSEPWEQCKAVAVSRSTALYSTSHVAITGNAIKNVDLGVWMAYNVSDIAITGNTVENHASRGVSVFPSTYTISNIIVSGNSLGTGYTMCGSASSGLTNATYHLSGPASPEGVISAPASSTYARTDGGGGTTLYVKESGSASTGWVALGQASWNGHDELNDTAYTDLVMSASNVRVPASSRPSSVAWNGLGESLSFDSGELIYIEGMQLPHGYATGTDLEFHVHFANDTNIADGQTIIWTFEHCSAPIYGAIPSLTTGTMTLTNNATLRAAISAVDPSAISGTTILKNTHLVVGTATISGTDLTLSSIISGKLEYDPSSTSTYTGECILLSADAHIQVNRLGSENEYSD